MPQLNSYEGILYTNTSMKTTNSSNSKYKKVCQAIENNNKDGFDNIITPDYLTTITQSIREKIEYQVVTQQKEWAVRSLVNAYQKTSDQYKSFPFSDIKSNFAQLIAQKGKIDIIKAAADEQSGRTQIMVELCESFNKEGMRYVLKSRSTRPLSTTAAASLIDALIENGAPSSNLPDWLSMPGLDQNAMHEALKRLVVKGRTQCLEIIFNDERTYPMIKNITIDIINNNYTDTYMDVVSLTPELKDTILDHVLTVLKEKQESDSMLPRVSTIQILTKLVHPGTDLDTIKEIAYSDFDPNLLDKASDYIKNESVDLYRQLIKEYTNSPGKTRGLFEIVESVGVDRNRSVKKPGNSSGKGQEMVYWAVKYGNATAVRELLSESDSLKTHDKKIYLASVNNQNRQCLLEIAKSENISVDYSYCSDKLAATLFENDGNGLNVFWSYFDEEAKASFIDASFKNGYSEQVSTFIQKKDRPTKIKGVDMAYKNNKLETIDNLTDDRFILNKVLLNKLGDLDHYTSTREGGGDILRTYPSRIRTYMDVFNLDDDTVIETYLANIVATLNSLQNEDVEPVYFIQSLIDFTTIDPAKHGKKALKVAFKNDQKEVLNYFKQAGAPQSALTADQI